MAFAEKQYGGLYSHTLPPPLEEAGLEDTALGFESIKEAFNFAAQTVKAVAGGSLGLTIDPEDTFESENGLEDGTKDGCTIVPKPGSLSLGDDLKDLKDCKDFGSGSCVELKTGGLLEEGKDKVLDGFGGHEVEDIVLEGEEPGPKLGDIPCLE